MKLNSRFAGICILMTIFPFRHTTDPIYDFHLITQTDTRNEQKRRCENLGYDGLAIVNTPEKWSHALKITKYLRVIGDGSSYLGFKYQEEVGNYVWDDGTEFRSDIPINQEHSQKPSSTNKFGRLSNDATIKASAGDDNKKALCGNIQEDSTSSKESWGSIMSGQLNTITRTVLTVTDQIFNYPECALMCGMTFLCRAAEFDSDLMTCTLIGAYTSAGPASANPNIKTFVRVTFNTD